DRAGLPSEPGRGFFQDVPLLAERLHLAPEAAQLLALLGGQTVLAVAVVTIGLRDPVADRLRRRLRLLRPLFRVAPGSHELNEPPLELRRVRGTGLGHRELLFPRKGSGVHETGGTSLFRPVVEQLPKLDVAGSTPVARNSLRRRRIAIENRRS